ITVVDASESETSAALIEYLSSKHEVEVIDELDRTYLEEKVFLMEIHGAVIIDSNFENQVKTGEPAVEIISDERAAASIQLDSEISKFLIFVIVQLNIVSSLKIDNLLYVMYVITYIHYKFD